MKKEGEKYRETQVSRTGATCLTPMIRPGSVISFFGLMKKDDPESIMVGDTLCHAVKVGHTIEFLYIQEAEGWEGAGALGGLGWG